MGLWTQRLLDKHQETELVAAIREAERGNRGEVRVHLERKCGKNSVLERAKEVFAQLGMHKTRDGTGVLLYVAVKDRKTAVYAGPGIHDGTEPAFWQEVVDTASKGFSNGQPIAGLVDALEHIGRSLREAVPGEDDSGDELPNKVSTS